MGRSPLDDWLDARPAPAGARRHDEDAAGPGDDPAQRVDAAGNGSAPQGRAGRGAGNAPVRHGDVGEAGGPEEYPEAEAHRDASRGVEGLDAAELDGFAVAADAPCLPCAAGLHAECDRIWTDRATFAARGCCDGGASALEAAFDAIWGEPERLDDESEEGPERPSAYFEGFTGRKALTEYVDPLSTGRKEAARKFPIEKGMVCEWAWLAAAGGGVAPIVGCPGYPATDIHHGPDKNTLRNVEGNVHRICANCHNRWHGANDPHYGERPPADQPFLPMDGEWVEHDPLTKASDEQVFAEEGRRRNESRRHGNLV